MSPDQILKAKFHSADINEKLSAAYWAESHKEYLTEASHEAFLKLAEVMGYTVEKKA